MFELANLTFCLHSSNSVISCGYVKLSAGLVLRASAPDSARRRSVHFSPACPSAGCSPSLLATVFLNAQDHNQRTSARLHPSLLLLRAIPQVQEGGSVHQAVLHGDSPVPTTQHSAPLSSRPAAGALAPCAGTLTRAKQREASSPGSVGAGGISNSGTFSTQAASPAVELAALRRAGLNPSGWPLEVLRHSCEAGAETTNYLLGTCHASSASAKQASAMPLLCRAELPLFTPVSPAPFGGSAPC